MLLASIVTPLIIMYWVSEPENKKTNPVLLGLRVTLAPGAADITTAFSQLVPLGILSINAVL